jgi:hypothetical protein
MTKYDIIFGLKVTLNLLTCLTRIPIFVPWNLRNKGTNIVIVTCIITQTYREDNQYNDKLVNLDLTLNSYQR